jgi:3-deoxy-D-manno-oct-2-ulosonic acid (Kdo) hydroxylase
MVKQTMELVSVTEAGTQFTPEQYAQLEAGNSLFFPRTPTAFAADDLSFLLGQRQSGAAFHKNIAYRPAQDVLTGVAAGSDRDRLHHILRGFSQQTIELLARLMPLYAPSWKIDYTSFRPLEEAGRKLSLHSRNDLLHVDAFPTRPTNGNRILRFFTNINPSQPRVWNTTEDFEVLAEKFSAEVRFQALARRASSPFRRALAGAARGVGLRQFGASPYDILMHRFHNFMKENQQFQENCRKDRWEFPPQSSWMVFTDSVSHAVLSGQFALEQTFIVSRGAMQRPEHAPVSVLERLTAMSLTWPA